MAKIEFKLDTEGVRGLLKSEELQDECMRYATKVVQQAGEGYEAVKHTFQKRAGVIVHPETPHAYYSNLKHNTLLKALHL